MRMQQAEVKPITLKPYLQHMFTTLITQQSDAVYTIMLNRPEVYNAFNETMKRELLQALQEAERKPEIRTIILTGAGKAFCSGQDLKDAVNLPNRSFSESLQKGYNPIIRAMRNMPKPIIGRLNGVAAGAGCSLALACDLLIAAEEASLTEVFIHIGLVLDSGSSYFLPRMVGTSRAFELATTGRRVSAREALELGIVNRVVTVLELDQAVQEMAGYYASAPTKAIGLIKKMLNKSMHSDLEAMLQYEAYCQEIAGNTHDNKEGVAAFLEKRKPKFRGD